MGEARLKAQRAHELARSFAKLPSSERSAILITAAKLIEADVQDPSTSRILAANQRDVKRQEARGMSSALLDRLALNEDRVHELAYALRTLADQTDPLGQLIGGKRLGNGLVLEQIRVPLGVVAVIYESRPNVTVDSFGLCVKTGNVCLLKGGSAAQESCATLVELCREALRSLGHDADIVQYVYDDEGHTQTRELLQAHGLVDVAIPRGGARLIQLCVREATVPTIETGTGNCHIYLHKDAALEMALPLLINAKCQRPGTCNSCESLLIHRDAVKRLALPLIAALQGEGVEIVADQEIQALAEDASLLVGIADQEDWATEYLGLKISMKTVAHLDEAIEHINHYGTGHSEAIVTNDYEASQRFLAEVDAAAVYVNASTRFTDGGVFGLGAEIGISTQKLHARGPMGAEALTTKKWIIRGSGQIR